MADQKREPQLHEVLAVEPNLEEAFRKVVKEATDTFNKKPDHFMEHLATVGFYDEERQREDTSEQKAMVTTVFDKLRYVAGHAAKYLDTYASKDTTNQVAKADLVVDGETIGTGLPATLLLALESKLKAMRDMYDAIPTLQPGIVWEPDVEKGEHIYVQKEPTRRFRTEKVLRYKVMVEPTKEHPAQVEKWHADVPIADVTQHNWSGMITPGQKSALLGRLDNLLRQVKKARQRANTTPVVKQPIGKALFDYIHGAL